MEARLGNRDIYEKPRLTILSENVMQVNSSFIEFDEETDAHLEGKFPYLERLCTDNEQGIAIYSSPDLLLLKANQRYLDTLEPPYNNKENSLGHKINEIITSFTGSGEEGVWSDVINNNKTKYLKRCKYINCSGVTYYNKSITPILKSGGLGYIVVSNSNVTEEVEEKMAVENTIKMQSEFFSFISHEFRTPLNVIMSAVQAVKCICKDELTSRSLKYLNKIYTGALQQLRLVNNLLDVTRAETGYLKIHKKNDDIISMTRSIINSVDTFASEKGIKLKFSTTVPELIVAIDDEKYERILLNLLSNAIKFTPKGKSIMVKIALKNNNVNIIVKDQGVGIPDDKQEIIFEKFEQVSNSLTRTTDGTGIGLCLVKLLVISLGGKIYITSKVDKGSTFEIILPLTKVDEEKEDLISHSLTNDRLIQMTNIEFSNIYSN